MPSTTRAYGWKRDRPDARDYHLADHVRLPEVATLPARVDLRETGFLDDPIFDQGQLGSCTANAIASALQYVQRATGLWAQGKHMTPSRLALYYWERRLEGTTGDDAGAELRDGLKVVAGKPGYVDEALWPYDISRFTVPPSPEVEKAAAADHVTKYMRVAVSAAAMKQALAAGFPVVVGFEVFEGIELQSTATTGVIPMPAPGEEAIGGHAMLLVGYDDARRRWKVRQSWGAWGDHGYGYLPYGYLDSPTYAGDFWTLTAEVEGGQPAPAPADPLHELAALLRQFITDVGSWLARHGL